MIVARWIAVPLTAALTWSGVLGAGLLGLSAIDAACPPDLVVSGMCTAWWYGPAVEGWILVRSAVVAAGLVLLPAAVAPAHRFVIATIAFVAGAAFAIYVASGGHAWGPFTAAACAGVLAWHRAAGWWRDGARSIAWGPQA